MVDAMSEGAGAAPVLHEAAKLQALPAKACCEQLAPCEVEHDYRIFEQLIGVPIICFTLNIMPSMQVHALALVHLWGDTETHSERMSASFLEREILPWVALE